MQLTDFDQFRVKLSELQSSVDLGSGERKELKLKLNDFIDAQDKRYNELKLFRDKIESLAKADCNCSSIFAGESN